MSRLVVMGSGETAPTMIRVHRDVFSTVGSGPAVLLDTPFAFQLNADELVARTLTHFRESVGHPVEVASWPRADAVGRPGAGARAARACVVGLRRPGQSDVRVAAVAGDSRAGHLGGGRAARWHAGHG